MYGRQVSAMIGFALAVTACGTQPPSDPTVPGTSSAAPSAPPLESESSSPSVMPFYDPDAPLEVEERPHATMNGAALIYLSYASPGGGRVSAWMVVPEGDGPFGGLVYLHGSETDRDDFVDEAVAMASGGAVSIVIDAPFARSGADRTGTLQDYFVPESEAALVEQTVADIRRAYDLLAERPDVDPARMGFVGHSWGASVVHSSLRGTIGRSRCC